MTHISRLLERANAREVRQASSMAATLTGIDPGELVSEYYEMMEAAPRRGEDGHEFFVERTGRPPQGTNETRREERLAMALVNDATSITVDGETVELLTYAFPVFSSGGPERIRAADLVGHVSGAGTSGTWKSDAGRFWVVELKVAARSGYGETPLRALYEALIYGAVVEANMAYIAAELENMGRKVQHQRPGLMIAASTEYWDRWTPNDRIGDWWTPYHSLTTALCGQLATPLETLSLGRISYGIGLDGRARVEGEADCRPVVYL